jgi:DNA-binding MarR family transcriptional regulator
MHVIGAARMTSSQELIDSCACTRMRTAARLMTRAYDEALRPSGVSASQLAILAAIDVGEATSIAELSKRLAMDRTTLSRNLRPLESAKWIRVGAEGWKRSRTVQVTAAGKQRLTQAASLWEAAQARFLKSFGKSEWKRVDDDLRAIATLF